MDVSEEALASLVAQGVAKALAADKAARDAEDRSMVEAAEQARVDEGVRLGFLRLLSWIGAAAQIEADKAEVLSASMAGLSAAIEAAIEIERFTYGTRHIKVAVFDASGQFLGVQEGRADLVDLNADDTCRRVLWRSEWDGPPVIQTVRFGGVGPDGPVMRERPIFKRPVPHLSEVADVPDETASPFSAYPVPDLD